MSLEPITIAKTIMAGFERKGVFVISARIDRKLSSQKKEAEEPIENHLLQIHCFKTRFEVNTFSNNFRLFINKIINGRTRIQS